MKVRFWGVRGSIASPGPSTVRYGGNTTCIEIRTDSNELIGADHSVVGAMLVEKWRFSADLIETIRHQHTPELMDTPMIACVFAANQISKKLAFGFGGNACIHELPPSIVQRLGGTLDDVILSLGDLSGVFEDARLFSKM